MKRENCVVSRCTYNGSHSAGRIESLQSPQRNHVPFFVVHIEYQLFIGIGKMQQSSGNAIQTIRICSARTAVSLAKVKIENLLKFELRLNR